MPVLKWGLLLLKVAAATQGFGSAVPDIGALLPDLGGGGFLNSYAASLTTLLDAQVSGLAADSVAALDAMLDRASTDADERALQSVREWVREQEKGEGEGWEPAWTGLVKTGSADGSMWVSPASADDYRRLGSQALNDQNRKGLF